MYQKNTHGIYVDSNADFRDVQPQLVIPLLKTPSECNKNGNIQNSAAKFQNPCRKPAMTCILKEMYY